MLLPAALKHFLERIKEELLMQMLKKFTAVVAILFIVSSVVLTYVSIQEYASQNAVSDSASDEGTMNVSTDENGNLVDANGNIIMTAEDMQAAQAQQEAEAGAAEGADGAAEQGALKAMQQIRVLLRTEPLMVRHSKTQHSRVKVSNFNYDCPLQSDN